MSLFTSDRERRLWLWTLAVVVAIYSTLGLAGTLAEVLRDHPVLPAVFFFLMFLTVAAIVGSGLKRRPAGRDVWIVLGVTAVYAMTVLRMGVSPEERTHLMEYSIVAVLIYNALSERSDNGRRVPVPALLAFLATVLVGWLDEGIQAVLPNRVYDNFDVFSNAIAATIGIVTSVVVGWVNAVVDRWREDREQRDPGETMDIRPARAEDADALAKLSRRVIEANYAGFLPPDVLDSWLAGDAVEQYMAAHLETCHVAEQNGELVAVYVIDGDLLDLLMVHPVRQGRGIGGMMLADAEARLFKSHEVIRLESFAANVRTNRFYRARGWRVSGEATDADTGMEKILFAKGTRQSSKR